MSHAFIETTALTNFLLKRDGSEVAAKAAFALFDTAEVPHFAWKEFKRGPLQNYAWAHNKLVETNSFSQTLIALQRLSGTPHRYKASTAIQAIHTAFANMSGETMESLTSRYGEAASLDSVHTDAVKLELKHVIMSAWRKRKTLFGGASQKLSCYIDQDIRIKNKALDLTPRDCPRGSTCCLQRHLTGRKSDLAALRGSLAPINPQSDRAETRKRREVLRQLEKHSARPMEPKDCLAFGDAFFVLFCPQNATIVTTNVRDLQPMAAAIGFEIKRP